MDQNNLLKLFERSPQFFCIVNSELHFEYKNVSYELLFQGRPFPTSFHEYFAQVRNSGNPLSFLEIPLTLDRDNYFIDIVFSPRTNDEGLVDGFLILGRDMTEQVRTSQNLRQNESLLRVIADKVPAYVSYTDPKGRYRFLNKTYSKWFDIPLENLLGKTRNEVVPPGYVTLSQKNIDKAFIDSESHHEVRLTRPDGKSIDLEVSYFSDNDPETQESRGIVAVGIDVTEKLDRLQEIQTLAVNLQEAVDARDNFMALASHELKTPLTSMMIMTEMHLRSADIEGPSFKYLSSFKKQIDRLNRLIEDMLDISRINSSHLEMRFIQGNFSSLVTSFIETMKPELEKDKIILSVSVEDNIFLKMDPERIEQVIANLVNNSIRYGQKTPLSIELRVDSGLAIFKISDLGPGIQAGKHEKIFERFERGINATSGLGLGLFICRQIVEAHGGKIFAETKESPGATFIMKLPLGEMLKN